MVEIRKHNQKVFMRLSVLALVIALGLTTLATWWKRIPIETSLAQTTRTVLTEAGLPLVNIHFDGRDGTLSGLLADEGIVDSIINTVASVEGVRTVHDNLTITPVEQDVTTPPPPDPTLTINTLYTPSRQHPLEQFDLSKIDFVYAQAVLTEDSLPVLGELAKLLQQNSVARIEISAHSDNQGTVLGQMASTQAKAEAVLQYLLTQNIDIERLSARGYGATRPLVNNDTEENRTRNRRVEITVLPE